MSHGHFGPPETGPRDDDSIPIGSRSALDAEALTLIDLVERKLQVPFCLPEHGGDVEQPPSNKLLTPTRSHSLSNP